MSQSKRPYAIETLDDARALYNMRRAAKLSPVYHVKSIVGDEPWAKQEEALWALKTHRVVTVASCHGVGKTFLGGEAAHWFLNTFENSMVITTAPTWRQVEQMMWRQIRRIHKKSLYGDTGRLLKTMLEYGDEWFAMGVSSDDTDKLQGFHPNSGHILVIADEAAGISEETWLAIEAIMTSFGARLLMIGNPTTVSGSFHYSHHSDPATYKIRISCFDTPNFTNNGIETIQDLIDMKEEDIEIVAPYLITPMWAKDKITRWGVESPMFQARVLGQFPSQETNSLISLLDIEAATTDERLEFLRTRGDLALNQSLGVDVARYGDDKTVITSRRGGIVESQDVRGKTATTETTGRVASYPAPAFIGVDADGVGGGVVDELLELKIQNVEGLMNGSSPRADDTGIKFANLRSQMWYNLAEQFRKGEIYIPPHMTELMAELSSIRYTYTRQGLSVEQKADMKKRLHKSPDRADSLMFAFADYVSYAVSSQRPTSAKRKRRDGGR